MSPAPARQRLVAVPPGLAGGDADLDQLAFAEQAHLAGLGQKFVPVETALDLMLLSHPVARRMRRGANGVHRLVHQQQLVAKDHIGPAQAGIQPGLELVGANQHACGLGPAAIRAPPARRPGPPA